MSWLFGLRPSQPPGPPPVPPPDGPPDEPQPGAAAAKDDSASRMAYAFDSAALERAAKAAKDLEKSPNAKEALELSKMQEQTRQLEFQTKIKVSPC